MEIQGKIVIVTGASSGIGLATAKLLGQNGAKVALVARSKEELEQISEEIPDSLIIVADMTIESDIKKMIQETKNHYGRIDILINNAGQGYYAPIEKINIEKYHQIIELNLIGPLIAMQEVIPIMKSQGSGTIINISSGTALMYLPNMAAYSSSKRALAGMTLTAREELKIDNIVVSVVYPYITNTNFGKNALRESVVNMTQREVPQGDAPELVAQKILEGIQTGEAEIFLREWNKKQ
ncbi:L-rhamnose 1-dehydrogenase (NADP(+)) [uncultured archaeon]|nr:L-rhamnose 1-dehydrogenase (NADP(+)) [uncultured archaeon]